MYYNFTLEGPAFRPTGCKGIDMPISEYPYTNKMLGIIHQTPTMECERSSYAPEGESVADIFDEFADDHDVWAEHFLDAWVIMMNNGAAGLKDAPQNSWLGHYTIKGNVYGLIQISHINKIQVLRRPIDLNKTKDWVLVQTAALAIIQGFSVRL